MPNKTNRKLSIFHYSAEDHGFSTPGVSLTADEQPSRSWQHDHAAWIRSCGGYSQPSFGSLEDLHSFNETGTQLTNRLQKELPNANVEPFQPIYNDLRVSTCSWWHLRDEKYRFPVSIQNLPVSDELKSDFRLWLHKRDDNCLIDDELRRQVENEGRKLEVRLYQELHKDKARED